MEISSQLLLCFACGPRTDCGPESVSGRVHPSARLRAGSRRNRLRTRGVTRQLIAGRARYAELPRFGRVTVSSRGSRHSRLRRRRCCC